MAPTESRFQQQSPLCRKNRGSMPNTLKVAMTYPNNSWNVETQHPLVNPTINLQNLSGKKSWILEKNHNPATHFFGGCGPWILCFFWLECLAACSFSLPTSEKGCGDGETSNCGDGSMLQEIPIWRLKGHGPDITQKIDLEAMWSKIYVSMYMYVYCKYWISIWWCNFV